MSTSTESILAEDNLITEKLATDPTRGLPEEIAEFAARQLPAELSGVMDWRSSIKEYVTKYPGVALLSAVAVGFVFVRMMSRSR